MTDYKAIADGVIEKLFDFEKATDWIKSKETKEIKISYKQSQDFDGRMFKCEYVIDAPVEKVVDVIMDLEKHLKWDSSVKTITSVEKIDEEMGVFYTVTPSYLAGLISSRDTCDLIGVRHIPAKDIYVIYGMLYNTR
ncbi:stAR-related lipid transfer protein 6-like [Saccoglossus kowalevskii]